MWAEIARHYWPLGWTTFGGPAAHIALLHTKFVDRLAWLDDRQFSELFAICQALPGPASTQMAFMIALYRGGFRAACLAFVLWSTPGLLIMTVLACLVTRIPPDVPAWVVHLRMSLNAVAVGLVFCAAVKLSLSILRTRLDVVLCWASAVVAMSLPDRTWVPPLLIGAGGAVQAAAYGMVRRFRASLPPALTPEIYSLAEVSPGSSPATSPPASQDDVTSDVTSAAVGINNTNGQLDQSEDQLLSNRHSHGKRRLSTSATDVRVGAVAVTAWLTVLAVMLAVRYAVPESSASGSQALKMFATVYITGSVIFGGGPVVVPLLYSYVVMPGWMTADQFLFGVAAINTLPGPNFNFAAYCGGVALNNIVNGGAGDAGGILTTIVGSLLAYLAIFIPGLSIKLAVVPLWRRVRHHSTVHIVLHGVATTAVGLVFAAIFLLSSLTTAGGGQSLLTDWFLVAVASMTFVGMVRFQAPALALVVLATAATLLRYS